jgi:exopolysaccharide biosynthesis polyprenyl glycosylphosphotransferase
VSVYVLYFIFFGTVFELYVLKKAESRFKVFQNLLLTLGISTILYVFTPYITPLLPPNRSVILYLFLSNLIVLTLWRFAYITFITSPRFYKRVFFVGENYNINQIAKELNSFDPNYNIKGYVDTSPSSRSSNDINRYAIGDMISTIKEQRIDEIVVANSYKGVNEKLYKVLTPLLSEGIPIKSYSKVYEDITKRILIKDAANDFYCYFPFNRSNQNKLYLSISRIKDIIISIIGLSFLVIIIPILMILNMFFNRGPLFYSQKRLGKRSKPFKIYKFRTMVKNAENNGAQWAEINDNRITTFGKFLRLIRLDECPQFFNILKGEMSLIGPRPERPEFVENLKKDIPFYETRHIIKPGLTGWAQVNAKYASSKDTTLQKLQYDLYYIKERSLYLDFRILVKTLTAIIFLRGR